MRVILEFVILTLILRTIRGQGTFWYINDIHYDPTYNDTNESCQPDSRDDPKGVFGHYECDPPWALIESSVKEMRNRFEEPKFIIWGGDNGFHQGPNTRYTVDYMAEIVKNITDLLAQQFPDSTVIPVLGNHDWWPKNQLPDDGTGDPNDLYDRYYEMWKQWIPSDQEATFKKAGFFSMKLDDNKITAIVLNTNLYLGSNGASSGEDPGDQFKWLKEQFDEARRTGTKVHLITHVPPAQKTLTDDYNKKIVDLIVSNGDVIHAVYGGHIHMDQFSIFFNESDAGSNKEAVSFLMLMPSVSPWRWSGSKYARNPGVRQLTYAADGELQDYVQYYLDLPEANDGQPKWEELYTFSNTYGKQKINTETLWSLAKDLQNHKSSNWESYYKFLHVDIGPPYKTGCECQCKEQELCAIFNVRNDPYGTCSEQLDTTCGASCCIMSRAVLMLTFVVTMLKFFL